MNTASSPHQARSYLESFTWHEQGEQSLTEGLWISPLPRTKLVDIYLALPDMNKESSPWLEGYEYRLFPAPG